MRLRETMKFEASVPVGLLWLLGLMSRVTLLAVPPVIPEIRADLQMSGTEVGLLS